MVIYSHRDNTPLEELKPLDELIAQIEAKIQKSYEWSITKKENSEGPDAANCLLLFAYCVLKTF